MTNSSYGQLTIWKFVRQIARRKVRDARSVFSHMSSFGTRNLLHIQVGKTHTIQILLHLRLCHLEWFHQNVENHTQQILTIVSQRILPEECKEEIEGPSCDNEETNAKDKQKKGKGGTAKKGSRKKKGTTSAKGKQKVPEKPEDMKSVQEFFNKPEEPKKRKATSSGTTKSKSKKVKEVQVSERKYLKSLPYKRLYGDTIQICYQMQDLATRHTAYLSYDAPSASSTEPNESSTTNNKRHLSKFKSLPLIPKRIVLWCYPFDPDNPCDPNLDLDGFARPDLVPIAQLFSDQSVEQS